MSPDNAGELVRCCATISRLVIVRLENFLTSAGSRYNQKQVNKSAVAAAAAESRQPRGSSKSLALPTSQLGTLSLVNLIRVAFCWQVGAISARKQLASSFQFHLSLCILAQLGFAYF